MYKKTVVFSGKKQSGKDTQTAYLVCNIINAAEKCSTVNVEFEGKTPMIHVLKSDSLVGVENSQSYELNTLINKYGIKIYSFADRLKEICHKMFGLDYYQCYGSDADKNTKTHIKWDSMPLDIRKKHSRPQTGTGIVKPASGYMKAREVLQVVGSDIMRSIDPNCHARGTYFEISENGLGINIIKDARFPNEISMGTERGAVCIRLLRSTKKDNHVSETALDNFPHGEFTHVIDNTKKTAEETSVEIWNKIKKEII